MKRFILVSAIIILCFSNNSAFSRIFFVTNNQGAGVNSLYAAIDSSNTYSGTDTIYFNFPAYVPVTIQLTNNGLPIITDSVLIDGLSQPGSSISNLLIKIEGNSALDYVFKIACSNTCIKGLTIFNLSNGSVFEFNDISGNHVTNFCNIKIQYNKIYNIITGININTLYSDSINFSNINISNNYFESFYSGIDLFFDSDFYKVSNIKIEKNILKKSINNNSKQISLLFYSGATVKNVFITANQIKNNYNHGIEIEIIGSNPLINEYDSVIITNNNICDNTGTGIYLKIGGYNPIKAGNIVIAGDTLRNNYSGIEIHQGGFASDSTYNFIIESNEITNNTDGGISLYYGSLSNTFARNYIIRNNNCIYNSIGLSIFNNGSCGSEVSISNFITENNNFSNNQSIGLYLMMYLGNGTSCFLNDGIIRNNIISNNLYGLILSCMGCNIDGNVITRNSVFNNSDNSGLEICFFDTILNIWIIPAFPLPVLNSVVFSGGSTTINGYITGKQNRSYRIEYFKNTTIDISGFGEGETYIGADTIITNSSGYGVINYNVQSDLTLFGITATSTDLVINNTSEFSNMIGLGVGLNNFINKGHSFSVFPNPAKENIKINTPRKSEIEILNLQGQTIKQISATESKTTIDISGFARGMYFIKLTTDKEIITKKFIKE